MILIASNILDTSTNLDYNWKNQQQRLNQFKVSDIDERKVEKATTSSSSAKQVDKSNKKKQLNETTNKNPNFTHPWLVTSLKGHCGRVLDMDFSSNGKYLATCGQDRTVFIWNAKELSIKEHRSLRINIEFDHAKFIKWSPDSKAFIIHKGIENVVEVYKLNKKQQGPGFSGATKAITFPKHYIEEVVGLGIAMSGRFIMTCNEKTELVIWDLKGQKLDSVDTYLMNTCCARVSPCGKFVAASGFAPDVKIWEVCFSKSGDYQNISRAFELRGHTSGILDFSFSCDSSKMATVSKDGTWKVYDTKIEYGKGEDPHLLKSARYDVSSDGTSKIAISPNGEVVALATGTNLYFFIVATGECDQTIHNVHTDPINCIVFDSTGKYVLTSGDKHIRVFHNVTGYKAQLQSFKEAQRNPNMSSAMKERIEQGIQETQQFLQSIAQ